MKKGRLKLNWFAHTEKCFRFRFEQTLNHVGARQEDLVTRWVLCLCRTRQKKAYLLKVHTEQLKKASSKGNRDASREVRHALNASTLLSVSSKNKGDLTQLMTWPSHRWPCSSAFFTNNVQCEATQQCQIPQFDVCNVALLTRPNVEMTPKSQHLVPRQCAPSGSNPSKAHHQRERARCKRMLWLGPDVQMWSVGDVPHVSMACMITALTAYTQAWTAPATRWLDPEAATDADDTLRHFLMEAVTGLPYYSIHRSGRFLSTLLPLARLLGCRWNLHNFAAHLPPTDSRRSATRSPPLFNQTCRSTPWPIVFYFPGHGKPPLFSYSRHSATSRSVQALIPCCLKPRLAFFETSPDASQLFDRWRLGHLAHQRIPIHLSDWWPKAPATLGRKPGQIVGRSLCLSVTFTESGLVYLKSMGHLWALATFHHDLVFYSAPFKCRTIFSNPTPFVPNLGKLAHCLAT